MQFLPLIGDRSLFPQLDARAYLAHAAIAPLSSPVVGAIEGVALDYAHHGVGAFPRSLERAALLRARFARMLGARVEDVAFVSNTTLGVINIAFGIAWNPGDEIVIFEDEFPANVTPWKQAAANFGLIIRSCPLGGFLVDEASGMQALSAVVNKRTRLIAVSAVQFKSGLRMPLRAISALAHDVGAEVFVDAIQGFGATPIDTRDGFSYLSCGSHKWLMGTEGAGLMYVAPEAMSRLVPRLAGWMSHTAGEGFLMAHTPMLQQIGPLKSTASVFEIGTGNMMGQAALAASTQLIESLGIEAIFAHLQSYIDELEVGLVALGFRSLRSRDPSLRSCILSVEPPQGATALTLATRLVERGVRCNTPDAVLRFSPHWPNSLAEVPIVLRAIEESLP